MFVTYVRLKNGRKLNFLHFSSMGRALVLGGSEDKLEKLISSIDEDSILSVKLKDRKKAMANLPDGELLEKFSKILHIN